MGSFEGIGVVAEPVSKGYIVKGIFKESPAQGKIQKDDIIKAIDGKTTVNITMDNFCEMMRKPVGSTLKVLLDREGGEKIIELKTKKIEITKESIPKTGRPGGKVLGMETPSRLISNLSRFDKVKSGDVFFLFSGERHIGYTRVMEVYESRSYLSVFESCEKPEPSDSYKYRLVYFAHLPGSHRYSIKTDTPTIEKSGAPDGQNKSETGNNAGDKGTHESSKKNEKSKENISKKDGKPIIKVESYTLFFSSTRRLRSKVRFRNIGDAKADNFIVTCYFVGNGRENLGQGTLSFRDVQPGKTVVGLFTSGITINPRKNFAEFTNGGRILKIYSSTSKVSRTLYSVECKFTFE